MIDLRWIRQLIDLMDQSDVDTVEISRFGTRVRICKSPTVVLGSGDRAAPGSRGSIEVSGTSGSSAEMGSLAGGPASAAGPVAELHEVTSPMVGTFFRAPAPDAPPYVEPGDHVTKGQTLCILEAMKLMNELESEVAGQVREVAVENAEPVEYGQVLFRIELDHT